MELEAKKQQLAVWRDKKRETTRVKVEEKL